MRLTALREDNKRPGLGWRDAACREVWEAGAEEAGTPPRQTQS